MGYCNNGKRVHHFSVNSLFSYMVTYSEVLYILVRNACVHPSTKMTQI